jgi:FkbM family methyltransferase
MPFVSYAQNYEDVMLWRALKNVPRGFYIDVGAHDPLHGTVTRAFYERGWCGINIEPTVKYHSLLSESRPRDINLCVAAGAESGMREFFEISDTGLSTLDAGVAQVHRQHGRPVHDFQVTVRSLNDIWAEWVKGDVHFLKIDVEGAEAHVLSGIDLQRWRPWIVVVEATVPLTEIANHQDWEPRLIASDYTFVYFDGLNRYYVAAEHAELAVSFAAPPNCFDEFVRESEFEALRELAALRAELRPEKSKPLPASAEVFDPATSPFLNLSGAEPTLAAPTSQLCTEAQFREPVYSTWCAELREQPRLHRKQWEFVYILKVLALRGLLQPGKRGLGFGCGKESLPAILARHGCEVKATDLDPVSSQAKGWIDTNQHASQLEDLNNLGICDPATFARQVSFRAQDMNNISADLVDFDFIWSSCAFEHLGSIANGLRYVTNAMRCLKPGGLAVHTTEFNLTSNFRTLEAHDLAIFRKHDIDSLVFTLQKAGHVVAPLNLSPGAGQLDRHVDLPPYHSEPHLRLKLDRFVTTSIGLIVTRAS